MNRYNFVGPAAQTVSAASALIKFTAGDVVKQKQDRKLATDRIISEEAKEVEKGTHGEVSALNYSQSNAKEIEKQIKSYAKTYGHGNAAEGYKINEQTRSEDGTNIKQNVIRDYNEAQRSVDEVKSKSSQPELDTNGVLGLITNQAATTDNTEEV